MFSSLPPICAQEANFKKCASLLRAKSKMLRQSVFPLISPYNKREWIDKVEWCMAETASQPVAGGPSKRAVAETEVGRHVYNVQWRVK